MIVCCINKVLNRIGSVVMVDILFLFLLLSEFCGVVCFIVILDGLVKDFIGLDLRFEIVFCFLIIFFIVFIFLVFKESDVN